GSLFDVDEQSVAKLTGERGAEVGDPAAQGAVEVSATVGRVGRFEAGGQAVQGLLAGFGRGHRDTLPDRLPCRGDRRLADERTVRRYRRAADGAGTAVPFGKQCQ